MSQNEEHLDSEYGAFIIRIEKVIDMLYEYKSYTISTMKMIKLLEESMSKGVLDD